MIFPMTEPRLAPMTWISPGDWTAMSNDGVWVLADTSQNQELVTDLWKAASMHGITADQVLGSLLSHGFDTLRGLAIAAVNGNDLRLIVRHPATARLETGDESEVVSAAAGTTWVDVTHARPARLLLSADGSESDGLELPLALGASTAKLVRVEFVAEAASEGAAVPEPFADAAPEPAPETEASVLEPELPVVAPVPPIVPPIEAPITPPVVPSFFDDAFGAEEPTSAVAAVPEEPAAEEPGDATAFMSVEEILAEEDAPAPSEEAVAEPEPQPQTEFNGPTVFAVRCNQGHLSSPMRPTCRVCGANVPEQKPFEVETPPLGVIVVPSGDRIPVDKGIVIGRAPIAAAGSEQQTITISFSGEISRQHAEITVEGWNVYVRDLNTTNGTSVTAPDRVTVQLRSGENYLVEPGSEIDLADVVTLRFEAVG